MGHGGEQEEGVDPMYWLMPLGGALGAVVVVWYERRHLEWRVGDRKSHFRALTRKDPRSELDAGVAKQLEQRVDGVANVANFWTGGSIDLKVTRDHYAKAYEMLALVCALLLSICVSFYTSNASNHLYGIVCCVANCALWMATLSSAFFAVVINACADDAQVGVLVGLFGRPLMRVPMMMFVWGSTMLFLEFILYFKINVDSGFNCSLCLGSCLVLMPLFFHCMHKMGWSALVVMEDAAACRRSAVAATPGDIRARLRLYVAAAQGGGGGGSGSSVLALDCDDFLASLVDPRVKATSVATAYARRLFDAHVEAALAAMEAKDAACIRFVDGAGADAGAAAAADATVPGVVHGVPTDADAACATAVPIGADQLSAKLSLEGEGGSAFRRVPSLLL